ncbi:hypothetical protein GLE_1764 [Lysobacter enzymogenes]|uniref:Uncharacterized protein n=1 Tax=Lysobacter enzymogenes TaxID=69 RepID=A0A0S2DFR2_LYSEN|nr:hypothetical protein [Lysobacter enzymogenes]ALN57119.1 hypothetical protein GLE_1764 [Lysobacter enzymogenes]QCW25797.1 hypothetical protein FE772_09080 [Lysobacter enzymogenes]
MIGIQENDPPPPQREDALFAIEGVLDLLWVEDQPDRLLSRIARQPVAGADADAQARDASAIAQAADGIERALYFAEDLQYFAGLIDGRPVCGQFAGADKLKPGHRVKAAVSRSGNALRAHAILDPQQGWLWIHHPRGSAADAKAERKLALRLFCCSYVGSALLCALAYWAQGLPLTALAQAQSWLLIGNAIVFGAMALSADYRMDRPSPSKNGPLRLLGFADPHRVDLSRYRIGDVEMRRHLGFIRANRQALRSGRMQAVETPELLRQSSERHRDVYDYRQAVADGKAALMR